MECITFLRKQMTLLYSYFFSRNQTNFNRRNPLKPEVKRTMHLQYNNKNRIINFGKNIIVSNKA